MGLSEAVEGISVTRWVAATLTLRSGYSSQGLGKRELCFAGSCGTQIVALRHGRSCGSHQHRGAGRMVIDPGAFSASTPDSSLLSLVRSKRPTTQPVLRPLCGTQAVVDRPTGL